MARKRSPRRKAIDKLDREWSTYVRYKAAEADGRATCVTCGKRDHPRAMHCGHFASRRHMATRWHADNTRVQCPGCNIFDQGRQYLFGRHLDSGSPGLADRIYRLSQTKVKYTTAELQAWAEELAGRNDRLIKLANSRYDRARRGEGG